ncbi:MAG: histidine kinase [Lachnospiraceae bacterium]|nr:histidine kinase [Lachnospiraceae bacterium]
MLIEGNDYNKILLVYSIAVTVALLGIVCFLIVSSSKKKAQAERMEKAKLEIMFSQIRPHFVYNVLNSIYYLCEIDPMKAQRAIENFADYMRTNLDSIDGQSLVTFDEEMTHIEKYMELEKMRFGDDLTIKYDIKVTDFKLPSLSIQPLMENAVKHGVGASENGGSVMLATEETDTDYVVTVSDSGVGYNPHFKNKSKDDQGGNRSHVGLQNVRERLDIMCGGKVDIYTTDGTGTRVVVRIPKESKAGKKYK